MKLSTKSIKEKIQAREIAKAAEEKKAAEQKKLEQAKSRERSKFLKEITEKILNAALEGASRVEIGVDCDSEIHEISHTLEERFIEIEEVYYTDYVEDRLISFLNSLSDQQISNTKILLFDSSRKLRKLCEELKKLYDEYHGESLSQIIDLLLEIFRGDGVLVDQIISFNRGCLELQEILEEISDSSYSDDYDKVMEDLSNAFGDSWLHEFANEDEVVFFAKWDLLEDDDVLNYEPIDDFFNSLGLAWLASTHGQLFVAALENLVEQKIENDESSLKMRLYKFSSGFRLEMENKSEVYTLLDEVGLTRLFTKLGYKVKSSEAGKADEVDLLVSWSSIA